MNYSLVYSPAYNIDLTSFGIDKPFALDRGQCVLGKLAEDLGHEAAYTIPTPVSTEDILRVHTPEYLERLQNPEVWFEIFEFKNNEYDPLKAKLPITDLIHDIRLKCGGTLLAAELALKNGLAANLGGGYHHAFPDQGRGYCVLHDIAIAIRSLQARKLCCNVMIVDLDFHQGDGSAVVFRDDPNVFTLSVHSEEGWPDEKQESTLDVPVKTDESHLYLQKTKRAVETALSQFRPDLCVYVAGSDPFELDVLPGTKHLKLSLDEMRTRDRFVIDTFADEKIPLVSVFAGGYGPDVWQVHYWATRRLLERAGLLADPALRA